MMISNSVSVSFFPVKDGVCPRAAHFGACVVTCGADEDCDGSKKCCSNGCGAWCVEPSKNQTAAFCLIPVPVGQQSLSHLLERLKLCLSPMLMTMIGNIKICLMQHYVGILLSQATMQVFQLDVRMIVAQSIIGVVSGRRAY